MHGCDSKAPAGLRQAEVLVSGATAVVVDGGTGRPSAASTGAGPKATERSGGEAAPLLEPLRKSCDSRVQEEESFCLRAEDCRCGLCPKCAGGRGKTRAQECEHAIKMNFSKRGRTMFLTFTADGTAFGDRACEFFQHVRRQRAIGHALRLLKRWGWIGESCRVLEFQANGMVHYHVIVDALRGHIPHREISRAWNRARNRPAWAGEPGVFEEGQKAGEPRPLVGFVQYERPDWGPGPDGKIVSPIVRYICSYMAKGGKNPHPQYFEDLCDGKVDGKRHNAQMFSASRGFFDGVRFKRRKRPPRFKRPPYRRKTVAERLSGCREAANLLKRIERHKDGEILDTRYEYLGTFSQEVGYRTLCYAAKGVEIGEKVAGSKGVWLEPEEVRHLMSHSCFTSHYRGKCVWPGDAKPG